VKEFLGGHETLLTGGFADLLHGSLERAYWVLAAPRQQQTDGAPGAARIDRLKIFPYLLRNANCWRRDPVATRGSRLK
jgi:hypothetical protein